MIDLRLDLALEGGLSLPGEGRIGVFNPPVEASLTALEKHDIEIVEGLAVGDRVILSDMSNWDAYDRVRLN